MHVFVWRIRVGIVPGRALPLVRVRWDQFAHSEVTLRGRRLQHYVVQHGGTTYWTNITNWRLGQPQLLQPCEYEHPSQLEASHHFSACNHMSGWKEPQTRGLQVEWYVSRSCIWRRLSDGQQLPPRAHHQHRYQPRVLLQNTRPQQHGRPVSTDLIHVLRRALFRGAGCECAGGSCIWYCIFAIFSYGGDNLFSQDLDNLVVFKCSFLTALFKSFLIKTIGFT